MGEGLDLSLALTKRTWKTFIWMALSSGQNKRGEIMGYFLSRLVFISVLMTAGVSAWATFLPPNDLYKYDRILSFDGTTMTETEFNQVIDKVSKALEPSVALHGASLVVERLWGTSMVNAASKQFMKTWKIYMYGGLARRPEITKDGFALVMCHEFGHHLGGYPFYSWLGRWAAAEGQADYFATDVCARKIWGSEPVENAKFRFNVPQTAKNKCDAIWKGDDDRNLCYRTAAAALSLADLLGVLNSQGKPKFETPDIKVVSRTNLGYASSQCRLDTYLQGSLCAAQWNPSVIPGRNHPGGQTSLGAERESAKYLCTRSSGFATGERPACWFKSRL